MAVETPIWKYKLEGDKQTASEMNQLAQAVIANATELSNAKDEFGNVAKTQTASSELLNWEEFVS